MKNQLQTVAMTILCWLTASSAALAKCEPILDVSARSWGIDVRITSASTQGGAGDNCAYLITATPVIVPAVQATIPATTGNAWTYIRPRATDTCQQQGRTSAAYSPPAGVRCVANLQHTDSATLLLHRQAAAQEECYDITVRPVLAEAVNPQRARQLVCLPSSSAQVIGQSSP